MDNAGVKRESRTYSYLWRSRYVGAVWIVIYILLGVLLTARGLYGTEEIIFNKQQLAGLSLIWGIIMFLVILTLLVVRRASIILQSVVLTEQGIQANPRKDGVECWPDPERIFIPWSEIDKVEQFDYPSGDTVKPDIDFIKMGRKCGIRILADDRKIIVYEHIQGYVELVRLTKSRSQNS